MKTKCLKTLTRYLLSIGLLSLVSCQDRTGDLELPKSGDEVSTKSLLAVNTPYVDWETSGVLPTGSTDLVAFPWQNGSMSSLPDFVAEDFRRTDGWELVYNTFFDGSQATRNYFMLYNKFKGIMRVFYFLGNAPTAVSVGYWKLSLSGSGNVALINGAKYFTLPQDDKSTKIVDYTAITDVNTQTYFSRGWNSFEFDVTYDDVSGKEVFFSLSPWGAQVGKIAIQGDFESNSSGTITETIVTSTGDEITSLAANAAGGYAKDKLTSMITNKKIKLSGKGLEEALTGGVQGLVKAGVNLLFGSFFGTTTSTKNYDLSFKTNGTIELSGTITTPMAVAPEPISRLAMPGSQNTGTLNPYYNKRLGVFNLKNIPVVKYVPKLIYPQYIDGYWYYKQPYNIDYSSINIDINPDISSEIDRYEVSYKLLHYNQLDGVRDWRKDRENIAWNEDAYSYGTLLFGDGYTAIYDPNMQYRNTTPPVNPTQPDPIGPYLEHNIYDNRFVVKVTVTLYPKEGYSREPVVITRSYLPTYRADPLYPRARLDENELSTINTD